MTRRYFTVSELNALIPDLERLVAHLRSLMGEMQQKEQWLGQAKRWKKQQGEAVESDTFLQEEAELDFLRIQVKMAIDRVAEMGGELKNVELGLVDFPGLIGGQEVLLCWKSGEERVAYYHGLYDGFVGRRPIPDTELGDLDTPPAAEA
jgi:hypothetical protein